LITISPSTNKPILERTGLSQQDLQSLPSVAHKAFKAFRNETSLKDRQQIVEKALKLLGDKKDELAKELTEQMGRPIAYTAKEITTAVARGEYLLKISDEALANTDGEAEKGFKRYIKKVPVGPVLVLFAWNVSYSVIVPPLILVIFAYFLSSTKP
jgi:acyl-CoA reductase-like NAD-dependent aldehyde dehydrogenase